MNISELKQLRDAMKKWSESACLMRALLLNEILQAD